MPEPVLFAGNNRMGFCNPSGITYLTSQYVLDYKNKREQIKRRYEWKSHGFNAMFRGDALPGAGSDLDELIDKAVINGIAFFGEGKSVVYSVSVGDSSGIFSKNPLDDDEMEGHIIHDSRQHFYSLDYNPQTEEIVVSMGLPFGEKHIAVFKNQNSIYQTVTEGDSVDENPVWGRRDPRTIYYDSAGLGRNHQGMLAGFGPRAICRLDLKTGDLDEVVSVAKHDCFLPKLDGEDRLYFIRRPYQSGMTRRKTTLIDILLIPYKILKAIYRWIEFFTIRYTGQPLTSGGLNPAKAKQQDPEDVFINGNLIHAAKTLKENQAKGEKFPGIAPRNWELVRMDRDGQFQVIKKGVIDFDVTAEGKITYSNGRHIIRMNDGGDEELLAKTDFVHKVTCCR